jgi:hypothetical protein
MATGSETQMRLELSASLECADLSALWSRAERGAIVLNLACSARY